MGIKIQSTKDFKLHGVKVVVHSPAGYGKTVLCSTCPSPLILSAEAGLLSLQDLNLPYIEVKSLEDVNDAYRFITESEEADQYQTICLDSVTEIAEVMLSSYKKKFKDARQAYGEMNDDIASTIRSFRDLPGKNVYFSAKQARIEDSDTGIAKYMPGMPGKTALNATAFYFDGVYALRLGQLEDGETFRYLQTQPTIKYEAKDRSGKLPAEAMPNLGEIFQIIAGAHPDFKTEGGD